MCLGRSVRWAGSAFVCPVAAGSCVVRRVSHAIQLAPYIPARWWTGTSVWRKTGSLEAVAYEFDQEYTVQNVEVYWLDFEHYDGNFCVPASWKLYYKAENGSWKEVEALNEYTVKKDCYNSLDFKPVRTTGLKITAQLQEGVSGGIIEWKVK